MTSITSVANDIIRDQKRAKAEIVTCSQCGSDAKDDLDLGLIELYSFCSSCDLNTSKSLSRA